MSAPRPPETTNLREQAADVLRRARRLPVGPYRNDLRQLAIGLLALDRYGFHSNAERAENVEYPASPK